MCTGRLDLSMIFRAFTKGADGVFIAGCHLNECNYITHGNFHALATAYIGKEILRRIGVKPERLQMELISGGEGNRFAELMNEFSRTITEQGPLGEGEGIDGKALAEKLEAVTNVIPYVRLVERERLRLFLNTEEDFVDYFSGQEFLRLFNELIGDKLAISQILLSLKEKPLSTGEIAKNLGLTPSEVAKHMNTSSRHGLVRYDTGKKCYALS